jgi:hypothetical protein
MTIHCLLQLRSCGRQQKCLLYIHRYSPLVLNIWKICVWAWRGYIAVNGEHQENESTGKLRQLQNMNLLGLDNWILSDWLASPHEVHGVFSGNEVLHSFLLSWHVIVCVQMPLQDGFASKLNRATHIISSRMLYL